MKVANLILFSFTISTINSEEFEYLFVHKFGGNKDQIKYYQENKIIPKPYVGVSFDGPEVRYNRYPDLTKVSMAQEKDVEVITNEIKNINKKVIAIGVSKGASTLINAASKIENMSKLIALVLDSPFSNANNVIRKLLFLEHFPGGSFISKQLLKKCLPNYNPDGIQPFESIKKISNKNLPILMIHSIEDKIVDVLEARNLYNEFMANGFKNVHFIILKSGKHANLIGKMELQKKIHAFYKKYSLPYDKKLAGNTYLYSYENIE